MKKEYVIWGVEKGTDYEQLLYTKAVSYRAAIKTAKLLEEKIWCYKNTHTDNRFFSTIGFYKNN